MERSEKKGRESGEEDRARGESVLGHDAPLSDHGETVHDGVLAVVLVTLWQEEVHHHRAVLAALLLHLQVGGQVLWDSAGVSVCEQLLLGTRATHSNTVTTITTVTLAASTFHPTSPAAVPARSQLESWPDQAMLYTSP